MDGNCGTPAPTPDSGSCRLWKTAGNCHATGSAHSAITGKCRVAGSVHHAIPFVGLTGMDFLQKKARLMSRERVVAAISPG
jgi:hypothetical protein